VAAFEAEAHGCRRALSIALGGEAGFALPIHAGLSIAHMTNGEMTHEGAILARFRVKNWRSGFSDG